MCTFVCRKHICISMHVCICIYLYVYACWSIDANMRIYMCFYSSLYIHLYVCIYSCIYVYIVYVCTHVCTSVYACLCAPIHMCIDVHMCSIFVSFSVVMYGYVLIILFQAQTLQSWIERLSHCSGIKRDAQCCLEDDAFSPEQDWEKSTWRHLRPILPCSFWLP